MSDCALKRVMDHGYKAKKHSTELNIILIYYSNLKTFFFFYLIR